MVEAKEFRRLLSNPGKIIDFKSGVICTEEDTSSWAQRVRKLSSIRHRNILLRTAHGDIMTRSRAFRFGLEEDMHCPDCGEVENLNHFFVDCILMKKVWEFTPKLLSEFDPKVSVCASISSILGFDRGVGRLQLTVNSEILLKRQQRYFEMAILESQIRNLINLVIKQDKYLNKYRMVESSDAAQN